MPRSPLLLLTSISGLSGVVLGALGAHAWRERLSSSVEAWHTASIYHLIHTVAAMILLIGASAVPTRRPLTARIVVICWLGGCLLFSGSIYLLALGGPRWLGPVTPLGGFAFISGWCLLAIEAWRGSAFSS